MDGSTNDETFKARVQLGGYVAYTDERGDVMRRYPGRLEFWDSNGKIPASLYGECVSSISKP